MKTRLFFSFLLFLLLSFNIFAQAQESWVHTLPNIENPVQLLRTRDGGYVVLSHTSSPEQVYRKPLLSKYNAQGEWLWSRSYTLPTIALRDFETRHDQVKYVAEKSNGDLWMVVDVPIRNSSDCPAYYCNRLYNSILTIDAATQDTLHTKYINGHIHINYYLHSAGPDDRYYLSNDYGDVATGMLSELNQEYRIKAVFDQNTFYPENGHFTSNSLGEVFLSLVDYKDTQYYKIGTDNNLVVKSHPGKADLITVLPSENGLLAHST